ncbi:MAG: DUF488 domain-containing protein [Chloroflexi bacterium]|nr:DUF488 domain-containing protein [Chloroflexota bacterium]
MRLATIGYEGLRATDFFDILVASRVRTLVDIRESPLSRKPGFSKGALGKEALNFGLRYVHLGTLGCPREIRHDYREDGDWTKYTRRFLAYLRTQERELENLLGIVSGELVCLLCFEADPKHCHRCYVAKAVADIAPTDLEIIHLGATKMPVAWLPTWADISTQL